MYFRILEFPGEELKILIHPSEAAYVFINYVHAWQVSGVLNADPLAIAQDVSECFQLEAVDEWQEELLMLDDGTVFPLTETTDVAAVVRPMDRALYTWLQRRLVRTRLEALRATLDDEDDDVTISVLAPRHILKSYDRCRLYLPRLLRVWGLIKYLGDTNALMELAATRDRRCLNAMWQLINDFLRELKEWSSPGRRPILVDAMHVSDFAGLALVDKLNEARHILLESPGALAILQLLGDASPVVNPEPHEQADYIMYGHIRDVVSEGFVLDRIYIKTDLDFHGAELNIVHQQHDSNRLGYVYAPLMVRQNHMGKVWVRWDAPAFFRLQNQAVEYPPNLHPEFHVVIGYNAQLDAQCFRDVAPHLCRAFLVQVATDFIRIIDHVLGV